MCGSPRRLRSPVSASRRRSALTGHRPAPRAFPRRRQGRLGARRDPGRRGRGDLGSPAARRVGRGLGQVGRPHAGRPGGTGRSGPDAGSTGSGLADWRGAGPGRAVGGRDHASIALRLSAELAVTIDVRFPANFVCLTPDSRPTGCTGCWSAVVKGCRTPAGDRRVRRLASAGRCPTSLRGGNRGGFRLGVGACSVYGDLTAADWLSGVVWSAGSRGSGQPRHRRDGLAATLRWRSRALLADLRAWGGVGQSGIVAGGKGRQPSGFSTG